MGQDGQTSWQAFPTAESIEAVVRHATSTGPLDREQRRDPRESLTPLQRAAAKRASAAIAALAAGDIIEHQRVVQQIVNEDGSALPLLSGLADMGRLLLYVSSTAVGSSAEAMLERLRQKMTTRSVAVWLAAALFDRLTGHDIWSRQDQTHSHAALSAAGAVHRSGGPNGVLEAATAFDRF